MKRNGAKINRIIASIACLTAALALAVFSCFAWFVKNQQVSSGISATLSDGNITDLSVHYYSLTGKTDTDNEDGSTTTTYSSVTELTADGKGGYKIGGYSAGSATLIVVEYTVNDGSATKLIFSGSSDSFSAEQVTNGYETELSNAVRLRLAEITEEISTVSSSYDAVSFYDLKNTSRTEISFDSIKASDKKVTQYILMEYDEDNIAELYPSGASFSSPLNFTNDIMLTVMSATSDGS